MRLRSRSNREPPKLAVMATVTTDAMGFYYFMGTSVRHRAGTTG